MKELHGLVGPDGDISEDLEYNSQYALPGFEIGSVYNGADVESFHDGRSMNMHPMRSIEQAYPSDREYSQISAQEIAHRIK